MDSILIDNEWLSVTLPEGFDRVPHKELESLMGVTYECLWGVRDVNRHMLITMSWKDSNKFVSKLANERSLAKRVDKIYARCRNGNAYRSDEVVGCKVSGADAEAQGFHFAYKVQGVDQEGDVLVFKHGVRCYTLTYYTRSECVETNRPVWEDIRASLTLR